MNSKAAQLREIENEETKAMSTNAGQQQVAIVTGASSGLGLGITRALLQRGFRVVANSRTISKSKELKPSADLVLVDGDIGLKETASKVAEAAVSHFGRIDLISDALTCSSTMRESIFPSHSRNIRRRILKRTSTLMSLDTSS